MSDTFWKHVDQQIKALTTARHVDDVISTCPEVSSGDGFFAGGGDEMYEALMTAGWRPVEWQAAYYWCVAAPDGGLLSYVEGDLYRGNSLVTNE